MSSVLANEMTCWFIATREMSHVEDTDSVTPERTSRIFSCSAMCVHRHDAIVYSGNTSVETRCMLVAQKDAWCSCREQHACLVECSKFDCQSSCESHSRRVVHFSLRPLSHVLLQLFLSTRNSAFLYCRVSNSMHTICRRLARV